MLPMYELFNLLVQPSKAKLTRDIMPSSSCFKSFDASLAYSLKFARIFLRFTVAKGWLLPLLINFITDLNSGISALLKGILAAMKKLRKTWWTLTLLSSGFERWSFWRWRNVEISEPSATPFFSLDLRQLWRPIVDVENLFPYVPGWRKFCLHFLHFTAGSPFESMTSWNIFHVSRFLSLRSHCHFQFEGS